LRRGEFDVLVGINLLREGLDLPEVSLVAILDADKEGFLRSPRSLIQTIGRAARNVRGEVIMYADSITNAMKIAIGETERRRAIQEAYNTEHGITPATVKKAIHDMSPDSGARDYVTVSTRKADELIANSEDKDSLLEALRSAMLEAAEALDFEKAAELRDRIRILESGGAVTPLSSKPVAKVRTEVSDRPSGGRGKGGPRGRGRR
jgi:excinuclease ABC subunit B